MFVSLIGSDAMVKQYLLVHQWVEVALGRVTEQPPRQIKKQFCGGFLWPMTSPHVPQSTGVFAADRLSRGQLNLSNTEIEPLCHAGKDVSDAVMQIVATVPVVMSAYVCHQSVHPVMSQVCMCFKTPVSAAC